MPQVGAKPRVSPSELPTYTAIDLFCGSGAVSMGLRKSGFRVLSAVDNDPIACRTYKLNHPDTTLIERNIKAVRPASLTRGSGANTVDLLVVCAPCQPFSSQNRKRGTDPRSRLLLDSVRFIKALRPSCVVIENVPGIVSPSHASLLEALRRRLAKIGYSLSKPRQLDAAVLGVPQRRVRCLLVASRSATAVSCFERAHFAEKGRTVRDAIAHLPLLQSGQSSRNDALHRARKHQDIALRRLELIPKDGGSRSALPPELHLACHTEAHAFPDVYGRMAWDKVAPTLTTGCDDVTRGRFAHPEQNRAITLREAACLQTFPEDYLFFGNRRQIARQIGNAVPVRMFEVLSPTLKQVIAAARAIEDVGAR